MSLTQDQINAYLEKIGFKQNISLSEDVLYEIVERHNFTFAFETIDIHRARFDNKAHRTSINLNHLWRRLVLQGRGTSCVGLNLLLQKVLTSIGFEVAPILSDDLWESAKLPKAKRPKHCAGIVTLDGTQYLVDAAFGGLGLLAPIPLKMGIYKQYSEVFRLTKSQEYDFELQIWRRNNWISIYGFHPQAVPYKAFKDLHDKNSNPKSPASHFKSFFACTKPFRSSKNNNGRYKLYNDSFTITLDNKLIYKKKIDSQRSLLGMLSKYFSIKINDHLRYDEPQMTAFHRFGISLPPKQHHYPTRLKERYDEVLKEHAKEKEFVIPDEPTKEQAATHKSPQVR